MSSALVRGMAVVETLAGRVGGLALSEIADSLGIPRSATHRLLADLAGGGYVRQDAESDNYMLTLRFVALGLKHLAANDLAQLAKPILEQLAESSGELVRLSLVDGTDLVWVSKFQGARSGLRYDPDTGSTVRLSCSASGHAWLADLPEDEALSMIYRQGIGSLEEYGPAAPQGLDDIRERLRTTRERGYATVHDTFEAGTSAMAVAVRADQGAVVGVISIAGPSVRLTPERMSEFAPELQAAVEDLSGLSLPDHRPVPA